MTAVTCDLHTGLKELSALEMGPFWCQKNVSCVQGPEHVTSGTVGLFVPVHPVCVFSQLFQESLLLESQPRVPARGNQTHTNRLGFSE